MKNIQMKQQLEKHFPSSTPAQQFIKLFLAGCDAWREAGKLYVEEVNKDPLFPNEIKRLEPSITTAMLTTIERIGRGEIHPVLVLQGENRPGIAALARLPMSVQTQYVSKPVPLLTILDGKTKIELKPASKLTRNEAEQVFSREGVRTPEEQAKVISAPPSIQTTRKWRVCGSELYISRSAYFTATEVKMMLCDFFSKDDLKSLLRDLVT
jgi:hypothetical protein